MVSYLEVQFDHYKFFIQEIIIYTVAVLIENTQYDSLGEFLKTEFFIHDRFNRNEHLNYRAFYSHLRLLDETRKQRL
jgi:urease accessory protein UreH